MNKFIITTGLTTPEHRNLITAFLQFKGWTLWHHFDEMWLIANVPGEVTAQSLYEEIMASPSLSKKFYILVLQLPAEQQIPFYGFAPGAGWPWVHEFISCNK